VRRLDRERYTPLALDLRGHGLQACVEEVLGSAPERFVLCGYSMGGRVALHVALAAPERLRALVLVSTTAGIEDGGERAERLRADAALAAEIEKGSIEDFVRRWTATPIFGGEPAESVAFWVEDLRRGSPAALAAVLRGLGAGSMAPVWDRLPELRMPATVVAGERDSKYVAIGERLVAALPGARDLVVVPGAGHGVPREAPAALAAAIAGLRSR
jgi:2-succinyl-6-hydroxy-2,4-cyclohexadiene-1-carboxylate synthase